MKRGRAVHRPAPAAQKRIVARSQRPIQRARAIGVEVTKPSIANSAIDVERIARLVAALALLLYITGLFAVNGYLGTLGMSDFTIVRTRFIYTGALILGSALVANALITGLVFTILSPDPQVTD